MRQSFGVIRCYRPLTLLPIASLVFSVLVSISVLAGSALVFNVQIRAGDFTPVAPRVSVEAAEQLTVAGIDFLLGGGDDHKRVAPRTKAERKTAENFWLALFIFYIANYVVMTYFNVALTHIALDRMSGGQATIYDGLGIAWNRKSAILQWAVLAATVGILLKMVRDRSGIGEWIARALGYIWKLASYFVMPLVAVENLSPGAALYRSGALLKARWGEVIIAGFSFPLLYFVLTIPGLVVFVVLGFLGQALGVAVAVCAIYWLALAVIVFSAEQVFIAALYAYAKDGRIVQGFSRTDLDKAWEALPALPIGQAL